MSWPSVSFSRIGTSFQNYLYGQYPVEEVIKTSENLNVTSKEDIKLYGIKAFNCFKTVWDFDDFWKRANTCDACLSLIHPLMKQYPDDPEITEACITLQEILEKNLAFFTSESHDDKWIDDFGWWGLMGIHAYQFLKDFKHDDLAQKYLDLSNYSWKYIVDNGCDSNKSGNPVEGGCRNTIAKALDEGVKNSVTNALLFLLSTKLYSLHINEKINAGEPFLERAYKQWVFFSEWFKLKEYHYLKPFKGNEGAALICERPFAFFNGSTYQDQTHPNSVPTWVWSGDNGLLLGALLNLIAVKDDVTAYVQHHHPEWSFNPLDFHLRIYDVTNKLILGIQKGMIGQDGVFYEPPCISSYITYSNDYFGGRGVLVRYMGLQEIKEFSGIDLTENVIKTVEALWSTRDQETNQFKPEFTNEESSLEYARHFDQLWDFSDQGTFWNIDANLKTKHAICQAVGLDFLAAALKGFR